MSRSREVISSFVILVLGLLLLAKVATSLRIWSDGIPGPGFFPALIAASIVLLSAAIVLEAALRAPGCNIDPPESRGGTIKVIAYVALMISLALLFDHLGFVISSLIFLSVLLLLVERQPLLQTVGVTAGAVTIAYILFVILLKVPLPEIGIGLF